MESKNTRLVVDIPEILHKRVRIAAAVRNITLKNWVMEAALEKLKEEELKEDDVS